MDKGEGGSRGGAFPGGVILSFDKTKKHHLLQAESDLASHCPEDLRIPTRFKGGRWCGGIFIHADIFLAKDPSEKGEHASPRGREGE